MDSVYLDILKEWEDREANPALYEHLDTFFPEYDFIRRQPGTLKDHWASRKKIDLSLPKHRLAEKTVVYRSELRFREQGDWDNYISVIDKIIENYGLSDIYAAYSFVSERLGLDMPKDDSEAVKESKKRSSRKETLLNTLVEYFEAQLLKGTTAKAVATRKYLLTARGFSKEDISRFHFGFVPTWNDVIRFITIHKGFRLEELDEVCGVRNEEGYTAVGKSHTLAIPYLCGGRIKGFLFRCIEGGRPGPKYIATEGLDRKSVFFNMPAGPITEIVVVEGEMDALKATAAGVEGVVAIGGSELAGERRRQVEDAFRRGVRRITLCLDLDTKKDSEEPNLEARHGHVMKCIHTIKDVAPSFEDIFVACFQEPTDPDQFVRERGVDELKIILDSAQPYWRYLYDYKEDIR